FTTPELLPDPCATASQPTGTEDSHGETAREGHPERLGDPAHAPGPRQAAPRPDSGAGPGLAPREPARREGHLLLRHRRGRPAPGGRAHPPPAAEPARDTAG